MPIPISNLQKQIQAPSVAKGQAINLAEEQKEAFKPALKIIDDISSAAQKGLGFVMAQQKADSQNVANDAYNKYLTEREDLWQQMIEKKEANALDFNDTYMQKAEASYEKALGVIDSIQDAEIREDARAQINKYNLDLAAKKDVYLFQEKTKMEDNNYIAKRDNKMRMALDSINVLDMNATESILNQSFIDLQKDAAMHYATRGKTPEQINEEIIKEQSQFISDIANKMAYQEYSQPTFNGYKKSLDFLYSKKDMMDRSTFVQTARTLENQSIRLQMARNPNSFIKNGKIDFRKISTIGKNLTEWEEWQLAQSLIEEQKNNKILSQEEKLDYDIIARRKELETEEYLYSNGIKTKSYYQNLMINNNLSKERISEIMADDIKNLSVSDLSQIVSRLRKEADIQVKLSSGRSVTVTSPKLKEMLEESEEALYNKIRLQKENREMERDGFLGGVVDFVVGENPTVREFVTERVMDYFTSKNEDGKVLYDSETNIPLRSASSIESTLTYIEQYAQSRGIDLNANMREQDRDPMYRQKLKNFVISSAQAATNIASGISITDPMYKNIAAMNGFEERPWQDDFLEGAMTSFGRAPIQEREDFLWPLDVVKVQEKNKKLLAKMALESLEKRIKQEEIIKKLFKDGESK